MSTTRRRSVAAPGAAREAGASSHIAREILLSFWKVHILHHALEHPLVGQWMLDELRRHGYQVSPGTLYPVLKRMTARGWLRCTVAPPGGRRARREYRLTAQGRRVLDLVRTYVTELHDEVSPAPARRASASTAVERSSAVRRSPRPKRS